MLNKFPSAMWQPDKTFLDPACGNGEFLVRALICKIHLGHTPIEALRAICGIELMPDNVLECQTRLLRIVSCFELITDEHINVVFTNIVCHDTLTYDGEFKPKEATDFQKSVLKARMIEMFDTAAPKIKASKLVSFAYSPEVKASIVEVAQAGKKEGKTWRQIFKQAKAVGYVGNYKSLGKLVVKMQKRSAQFVQQVA